MAYFSKSSSWTEPSETMAKNFTLQQPLKMMRPDNFKLCQITENQATVCKPTPEITILPCDTESLEHTNEDSILFQWADD